MPARQVGHSQRSSAALGCWLYCLSCSASDDVIARAAPEECRLGCGEAACPCQGPQRIAVEVGELRFAIDATEVTAGAYARFLENQPARLQGEPSDVCFWNESYVPTQSSFDVDPNCIMTFDFELIVAERPELPVVCVDVCDARDYCSWIGGRLCGAAAGGELAADARGSASDEWFNACSAGGAQPYCYGSDFEPAACNTRALSDLDATLEVGSLADCEGPLPGLFDMNGNVKEWIANCQNTQPFDSSECFRVGGAYFEFEPEQSRCDAATAGQRSTLGNDTGFRCCYDP